MNDDGYIDEDQLFDLLSQITNKDLPILTERQLQDVISHDFPLYKAQYLEWEKQNPSKSSMKKRPKLPGRLDFDEFKFIVEVKYNYQS